MYIFNMKASRAGASLMSVLMLINILIMVSCKENTNVYLFNEEMVVPAKNSSVVTVYIVINVASSNKGRGVQHYIEHLVWSRIAKSSSINLNQHTNAWTNQFTVGYWLTGKKDEITIVLDTLFGVFAPLDVSFELAKKEQDIVLREYDYRLVENLKAQANVVLSEFLYKGNDIAKTVIGTPESIAKFDLDTAKALHAATHRPENAVLVVVGDVTERELQLALKEVVTQGKRMIFEYSQTW